MEGLTTPKLARQGVVNVETIRYYEKHGLLPRPPRTPSGYRMFSADSFGRLHFIRRAQQLGFTLKEIKDLLSRFGESKCLGIFTISPPPELMSMWLLIWPVKRTENERSRVGKPGLRLAKAEGLVLDSVSSPITGRVYSLALDEFIAWFGLEPRPGFTKATVNAWRASLEARGLGVRVHQRSDHSGPQAGG
jgi:DNA-binding transcriptional MerR regulator